MKRRKEDKMDKIIRDAAEGARAIFRFVSYLTLR